MQASVVYQRRCGSDGSKSVLGTISNLGRIGGFSKSQNTNRTAASICRGVPLPVGPVFTSEVIRPKLEGADMSANGFANCARFKRLNHSPLSSRATRSFQEIRRFTAVSICHSAGPRNALRPRFPHVPFAGAVKAAKLIQSVGD